MYPGKPLSSLLLVLGLSVFASVSASAAPIAMVYFGKGTCAGCPDDLAKSLVRAGFEIEAAYPGDFTPANLASVDLVAFPGGGEESATMHALRPGEARTIHDYVAEGGHYLGVCMGAFLASPKLIDTSRVSAPNVWKTPPDLASLENGLNLFDGIVHNHAPTKAARMEIIDWRGAATWMYFQDGPDFELNHPETAEIWAKYSPLVVGDLFSVKVAAFQAPLGSGRVGLIGPHLEADQDWLDDDGIEIPDGTKYQRPSGQFTAFVRSLIR
jgi:hypothetical protein